MNKREFEKYVLSNLDVIEGVQCNIVEGYNLDNELCCWLDVYISGDEFATIFCSDDYTLDSKEIIQLQKKWLKKLEGWINPNWGLSLSADRTSV